MKVLGLIGAKGSGKDTMAGYLVQSKGFERIGYADALYQQAAQAYSVCVPTLAKRETKESNLAKFALARCSDSHFVEVALKSLTKSRSLQKACLAFQKTQKMPAHAPSKRVKQLLKAYRSPRWTLQLWGTEYRRASRFGTDSYWLDIVAKVIAAKPHQQFVITDVRFLNEARFVASMGGVLMRVRRPALDASEAARHDADGTSAHPSEAELRSYVVDYEVINEEGMPDSLRINFNSLGLLPELKAA